MTTRTVLAPCVLLLAAASAGRAADAERWCATTPWGTTTAVWEHREQGARRGAVRAAGTDSGSRDVGQIAVLKNEGDLILPKNLLDLQGAGLQFVPAGRGYAVTRVDRPVSGEPGTRLSLSDDASVPVDLPFTFPFFGSTYRQVHVNSDGNLTFGAADAASTARDLGRFLGGPPRIAPLLTDVDPGKGGTVTTSGDATRLIVTWSQVPLFETGFLNTFQVTLHPDGRIELAYGNDLATLLEEGVVGIAPGSGRDGLTPVDLSSAAAASGPGALGEAFRELDIIDPVAIARKFYATHRDDYQQLVVFTSRPLGRRSGYIAYELTVKNTDAGIGDDLMDLTAQFGSAGGLESFVTMDFIMQYPEPFDAVYSEAYSPLGVLAHETAHRWGIHARFRDGDRVSDELLGRQLAHWSFLFDSDASFLEGNDLQDLGGGTFRSVAASQRYSALDLYLMGLRSPEEVGPLFLVRSGTFTADTAPRVGAQLTGTRKDLTIADIVAALGPRNPPPGPRPPFRQAFVYLDAGVTDADANVARVERFRAAWEPFFARAVEGRGSVDTRLN